MRDNEPPDDEELSEVEELAEPAEVEELAEPAEVEEPSSQGGELPTPDTSIVADAQDPPPGTGSQSVTLEL